MSAVLEATAARLSAGYRRGELTPVEVTETSLTRIELADPVLNAFCLVDAGRALADARASEERWRHGEPAGALDGVPVAVKDIFLTRGWPTARLARDRSRGSVGGRRARGRRAAPQRRGARRQDDDPGARLEGRHRQPARGRHAQPVGSLTH